MVIASKLFVTTRPPILAVVLLAALLVSALAASAAVYITPKEFISKNLSKQALAKSLWLKKPQQKAALKILGHRYRGLRVRYWQSETKSAWILDEIGKDQPITIGVIINENQIEAVRILTYREPRGGEVRHPFFTRQYEGLSLNESSKLSGHIDGISGATLSVRAVTNISRYALYLNQQIAK